MLQANHAVRAGLRASSRNPELAFARALLDQLGNLLALLPIVFAFVLLWSLADRASLLAVLHAARALGWVTSGAVAAAAALAFSVGMLFWAGALPLVAADAELDRRPPSGHFAALASRGLARVLLAGILAFALELGFSTACTAALVTAMPAALVNPSPLLIAGAALVSAIAIGSAVLLDLLGRLWIIRAACFAEGVSASFGKAVAILSSRLGACFTVTVAFLVLDLIAAAVAALFSGLTSGPALFDPGAELLALAPRIAVGLAAAAVFSWLEVARMGALCALVLDVEGLIGEPPMIEAVPVAEPVVEALPVSDE